MKSILKTLASLSLLITPSLALCIPTTIKGVLMHNTAPKLSVSYKKEFLVSKKADIKLTANSAFQFDIDIEHPTEVVLSTPTGFFLAYVYPGVPLIVKADMSGKTDLKKVVFSGEVGMINTIFSELYNSSEHKTKVWKTDGDESLAYKLEKIENYYPFRRKYIADHLNNATINQATRAIISMDSIAGEYKKATGIFTLMEKYSMSEAEENKLIADKLAPGTLKYPDKEKLAIPQVRDFWYGSYISHLISNDARKIKDLYKIHGYYLSALAKTEQTFPSPLRDYVMAGLLGNLLVKPSEYRPGADSLVRRVKSFIKTADLPNETKAALEKSADNAGTADVNALTGMPLPNLDLKNAKGQPLQLGRSKDSLVLMDLWAGWCGPCVAQFPAMEKVKEHYKGKKLSIIMVSFDKNEQDWNKAMVKHKLTGNQYFVPKGFESDLASFLIVKGIPRYILVKNGIVLNPDTLPPSDGGMITQINEALDVP